MRRLPRVLTVVGAVALLFGLMAGLVNRQLIDSDNFAKHADAVRTDDDVARHLAVRLTDELLEAEPDLIIARPLLQATLQEAVRSPAFSSAFRAMVSPLHQAFITGDNDAVVFRLADVGAVLVAAVRTISPEAAAAIPSGLDVQLATIGAEGTGSDGIALAEQVRLLAWLLPLIALACFAGALLLAKGRRLSVLRGIGISVVVVGIGLAVANLATTFATDKLASDSLGGAVLVAGWNDVTGSVRDVAIVAAAGGYLLVLAARVAGGGTVPLLSVAGAWRGPESELSPGRALGRAAVMFGVGVLLVLEPLRALSLLVIAAGVLLVVRGLVSAALVVPELLDADSAKAGRRWFASVLGSPTLRTTIVAAGLGVLAVVLTAGMIVWNSSESTASVLSRGSGTACNGSKKLCDRRYDEVSFVATHNSMSAADQPNWFLAEQPKGILAQLDDGVRVFLIDTWYAQATNRSNIAVDTDESQAKAFAQAEEEYGTAVLESALRLRDTASLSPQGNVDVYLCHAMCVLGSTQWEPLMEKVRAWLDEHPREVVTFFVQDETTSDGTIDVVEGAGLLPYIYTPTAGEPWPTLGEMIDSGRRVVFLAENNGGGSAAPWLLQGFDWVQDTPFKAESVSDFSCAHNRGDANASIFLVNHWLDQPLSRVSSSLEANSKSVLGGRLSECQQERGMLPNYVAVDMYDQGDVFGQVERLNGLD